MKPKHQRLIFVSISLVVMTVAATVILSTFRDTMVFFYTPSQLIEKKSQPGFDTTRSLRIGGLVKEGSVRNLPGGGIRFVITDLTNNIRVTYQGFIPTLFRDGQGVVAEGTLGADGVLAAKTILAKHDETYMPREVVDQLKASGRWKSDGASHGGRSAPATAPPRSLRSGSREAPRTDSASPEMTP